MKFIVIGITDSPSPCFSPEVLEAIHGGKVFSGGRRHHAIVASLLPPAAQWIDITVPLDAVFAQYEALGGTIVVFASGDPLFFGFANTIKRMLPQAEVRLFPSFNALQTLAHRLLLPYHDMRIVSLTGRPWHEFDRALIEHAPKLGVLTDREHTPAAIAKRMLEYGFNAYQMTIGEHLGHPAQEKVTTLALEEAACRDFSTPNCLILCSTQTQHSLFGVPDQAFTLLHGREKMITKMPIRLLALQALDLTSRHSFWDIGFCTGSVSIEARLLFPHLHVEAFEIRPECEAIISENARRLGAPGIAVHMGDFCAIAPDVLATYLPPDAVFIGGHGGRLKAVMAQVLTVLAHDGIIVMNSVTPESRRLFCEACQELGLEQLPSLHVALNDYNPIDILKCRRK